MTDKCPRCGGTGWCHPPGFPCPDCVNYRADKDGAGRGDKIAQDRQGSVAPAPAPVSSVDVERLIDSVTALLEIDQALAAENERLREEVRRMFRNGKTVCTTQRTVTAQICYTREFLAALEGKDEKA